MRQVKRKKKVLERRKKKQEVKGRGGETAAKRRHTHRDETASSPERKAFRYIPGFGVAPDKIHWKGHRDSKLFTLTGKYSTLDLIENFKLALEKGGAWGNYHAREWFTKLFQSLDYPSWPLNALRNCYRDVYEKDAPDLHPVLLKYLVYGKLSIRWLKEEVKRDGANRHNMYSTWKNLIPKVIAKQKAIRKQDLKALPDSVRKALQDEIESYKEMLKGDSEMAKKAKKGKKVSKKTSSKKSSNGNGESVAQSILAVGHGKRGTVTRKWILEKIIARRLKLKLMKASEADKLRISSILKRHCESGEMTLVAVGQYSFDGGSKPISGTKAAKPSKKEKKSLKKPKKSELTKKERRALRRKERREAEEETPKKNKKHPKKKHPKKSKKSKK